ncbi:E3 binding domain-containing protein [Candidatus Chloroploca sp. M-50]|uniref:E3 binding domain-containing protein n=1 Tax=Candidatus Chloroploca mongolica TaxID=2528176 RepID=A0ABS4D9H7_9CHLR|nr:E3 binding domain-containing protein [Candidatus Chloroploca mongolica]MBP1466101.1 E3 binding domain-containing protein [Candidatus Chloroploca mongolica]
MHTLSLPALPGGAAVVTRWLVQPDAHVTLGTPLVIVVTSSVEVLIPADVTGRLCDPVPTGMRVAPGALLARIEALAEAEPALALPAAPARCKATPLARRIALVHGIALDQVTGSGPHGQIRAADVRALLPPPATLLAEHADGETGEDGQSQSQDVTHPPHLTDNEREPSCADAAPQPALTPVSVDPESGLRPVASLTMEFDATATLAQSAALPAHLARLEVTPFIAPVVLEALAALLPAYPLLNGAPGEDGNLVLRRRLHFAIGLPDTAHYQWHLVYDASDLNQRGLTRALAHQVAPALDEATFAIVFRPEGAAGWQGMSPLPHCLAVVSVTPPVRRLLVVNDSLAIRPVGVLTISYDARIIDEQLANTFLRTLCTHLEAPSTR